MTKSNIPYIYGWNASIISYASNPFSDSSSSFLDWWKGRIDGWIKWGFYTSRTDQDLKFRLGQELYNRLLEEEK